MSRWKELPSSLDEREHQLVVQLRRLKDHSGLSLAALAARTSYSRSSWERYLNGKKPAPRDAVEELARVCQVEPTRLLVLWDVAERERGFGPPEPSTPESRAPESSTPVPDTAGVPPEASEAIADARSVRTVPVRRMLAVSAAAVLVAFGAGLFTGGAWGQSRGPVMDAAPAADSGYRPGRTYPCRIEREEGGLRAGHSTAREILLDANSSGWDVVEAQCLLDWHGFNPGDVDGVYGERTKGAVVSFQKRRGLDADGVVGPDTWGELRR
ncbi:peptidoglycan-binding protein [Streptomyces sp. NPDC005408]|uniref:helix-turn-helix domain-containing protein n=1 Tax=Streptomyces sp. NPDC005408 TaxID=3155341 RepID=UPI0033A165BD